jgi:hypothetical protein
MLSGRVFPKSLYNVVLFFVAVKRFSAAQEENRRQAPLQDPTLKRPDSGGTLQNQLAESASVCYPLHLRIRFVGGWVKPPIQDSGNAQ